MKNVKGFTLVEIMLGLGLGAMVVISTASLLYYFFTEKNRLDTWSSGQLEMSIAVKSIESDIRNVVRMDPMEDLRINNDSLYFGLTSINAGEEPSFCSNNATSSVFRYTTLNRILPQAKSMRTWSEIASSDNTGAANELRVSVDTTGSTLFSEANAPKEIVIVDADRRYIRRYEVVSSVMHLNMNTDPYDDAPKTDSSGNPIIFNYASVFLKRPKTITGAEISAKTAVFITGSDVYASSTNIVCLRKDDRSVIRYNSLTQRTDVLLVNTSKDFDVQQFIVKYLATKKGVRVDPVNFFASTLSDPQGLCVNAIYVNIDGQVLNTAKSATQNKDFKSTVGRNRTIFATNLSSQRPLSCNQ
jgi:type II secretory pathway component PulJ